MEEENNLLGDPCINLTLGNICQARISAASLRPSAFLSEIGSFPQNSGWYPRPQLMCLLAIADIFGCYLLPTPLAGNTDFYFPKLRRLSFLLKGEVPVGHYDFFEKKNISYEYCFSKHKICMLRRLHITP